MWLPIYACLEGEHFTSGLLVIHKGRDFPKIPGGGRPATPFSVGTPSWHRRHSRLSSDSRRGGRLGGRT